MLRKSQRLNLKTSFKLVQSGRRTETPSLRLMWRSGESEMPLVGIALTKASFRKAHERNRAKRLAATAIQQLYPRLRKGLNLVIMPKAGILAKSADQLISELEDAKDLYQVN